MLGKYIYPVLGDLCGFRSEAEGLGDSGSGLRFRV